MGIGWPGKEAAHRHTDIQGYRGAMGTPPPLAGRQGAWEGIGRPKDDPTPGQQGMEVNSAHIARFLPIIFLSIPPWVCRVLRGGCNGHMHAQGRCTHVRTTVAVVRWNVFTFV